MSTPKVGIVMGSDSDLPVMKAAAEFLDSCNIPYELLIVSAHRTPDFLHNYGKEALGKGLKIIIAGAGGSAHLPGMLAALTPLPVIGVPIKSSTAEGVDSLFSIVQMPPGIPVATVAINGAHNAAILAAEILGLSDESIQEKVVAYKQTLESSVLEKSEKLASQGFKTYLEEKELL